VLCGPGSAKARLAKHRRVYHLSRVIAAVKSVNPFAMDIPERFAKSTSGETGAKITLPSTDLRIGF
jgi:hypothetical protein